MTRAFRGLVDDTRPGHKPPSPLLSVDGVCIDLARRDQEPVRVVEDVSFDLGPGECLAIVGESGSGKTLTGLSLMGLLPPVASVAKGEIRFRGVDLVTAPHRQLREYRGGSISMIFQDPLSSLNPVRRVGTMMIETIMRHQDCDRRAATELGIELFHRVGIASPKERFKAYPHQLSGGMRQRVMIALAIVNQPELLIADEPTTALDATIQMQVLALIKELTLDSALLIITHDLGVAAQLADRVLVMYAGRVMEEGATSAVLGEARHPYTRGLMGARPRLGERGMGLKPIPGSPIKIEDRGVGCPFSPRCARSSHECRGRTDLVEFQPGHSYACWHPHSGV